MPKYTLSTNIPTNDFTSQFQLSSIFDSTGDVILKLRETVVEVFIDYELIHREKGEEYSEHVINDLTNALRDGRSSMIYAHDEDDISDYIPLFANEKNVSQVAE